MDLIDFIILSLATWRIANMIVDDSEDGPWDVLHFIRYLIGVRYDDEGRIAFYIETGTELTRLEGIRYQLYLAFTCFWCASIYIGLLALLVWFIPNDIGLYLLAPFALSAGALIVKGAVKK